ncbi:MAG TPA: cytochrome c [Saprospiraceae bacterium]|nr:cytochrome c [Saprospiraceae bacterium]
MKDFYCLFLIAIMGFGSLSAADSLMVVEGGNLFKLNCTACHQLEQRLVGPALKGVDQRHDEAWILKFVRSSQTMVQSGDSVAVALFNTYNSVIMPDQNLNEDQIRSILAYIKDAEKPRVSLSGGIQRPEVPIHTAAQVRPPSFSDYRFWILYTVTVVLIIVSIYYKAELIALRKKVKGEGAESIGMGA